MNKAEQLDSIHRRAENFIGSLKSVKNDRGAIADLRRGFIESQSDRTWQYIRPYCNIISGRERLIFECASGFFGECHNQLCREGNLGTTISQIAKKRFGNDGKKHFESSFMRLLNAESREDLTRRLPPIAKYAASESIPVNITQLIVDIYYWGENIRVSWASEYWG